MDHGVKTDLTEEEAREWASRRWGCVAETEHHPHQTSFGDSIATITVHDRLGHHFQGIGYSGMAPWGVSMWHKAAVDLLRYEPLSNVTT